MLKTKCSAVWQRGGSRITRQKQDELHTNTDMGDHVVIIMLRKSTKSGAGFSRWFL